MQKADSRTGTGPEVVTECQLVLEKRSIESKLCPPDPTSPLAGKLASRILGYSAAPNPNYRRQESQLLLLTQVGLRFADPTATAEYQRCHDDNRQH